ncbi:DUF5946 family protein [Heyndrickxia acidicola]|uniref:DUF5946 family protein n=1 Tax=Heyndrickxia acidicola TaxID=209389 RepID=A0ABU6MKQ9_9BACI|nr:DUF5946 family protein [Heyndrickxia acidicola]MED1205272.1 DUF5946 family protein [Heyndrickxia acidicola]
MADNHTIKEAGKCMECGASEVDGLSCYEMFQFLLVWEHNDPALYQLHFWLVSCYMIQHPSNFTKDGYQHLLHLFTGAYDHNWETDYILRKNREGILKRGKITNPLPNHKRKRIPRSWSMTIEDVYRGGEKNAITSIQKGRETIRRELS